MVGWHYQLDGHESAQTPGDSEGQGSLACCSPPGHRESDTTLATEQQQQEQQGLPFSVCFPVEVRMSAGQGILSSVMCPKYLGHFLAYEKELSISS